MKPSRGILSTGKPLASVVLDEILGGGQSFLWEKLDDTGNWRGVCCDRVFRVGLKSSGELEWQLDHGDSDGAPEAIEEFFALETPFGTLTEALPWRSDPVLATAIRSFRGLRILRQPVGEALLSFLLSPLKRIDQIRSGLVELSRRFGDPIGPDQFSPPDWVRLAGIPESDLRSCGIGYRAKGISQTARVLANDPELLRHLSGLPTGEARARLMKLPGVGRKIADCVLLFGLARHEAFPIDTWISRELRTAYQLDGFTEAQLQQFAAAHYGPAAGLAQQFLFAAARKRAREN